MHDPKPEKAARASPWRQLAIADRRRARQLANANAALWSLGNGLTSTTLVIYLARQLGAAGVAIGLIVAAPPLAGVLRWFAPALIGRLADRKRFCLVCYYASGVVLALLPVLAQPTALLPRGASLALLVVLWCVYHLLEYLGTVALWSWLGDLVPGRIRGRFVGRRERWLKAGRVGGMLASGLYVYSWQLTYGRDDWYGYAVPALIGAGLMVAAVLPLLRMPSIAVGRAGEPPPPLLDLPRLLAPLADRRFLRLMLFGCWLGLVTGLTQAVQFIYPTQVLALSLLAFLSLRVGMEIGQSSIAAPVGRLVDRFGNRPVMVLSQLVVAIGPLFYIAATPEAPWWIVGAWLFWIAYAGLNVALPNLMLKLATPGDNSRYVATYFATAGLFYGLGSLAGGFAYDILNRLSPAIRMGPWTLNHFEYLFACGAVLRLLGVPLLLMLVEPGAWTWREIVSGNRGSSEAGPSATTTSGA